MELGKRYKIMRIVALIACVLTAFQAASSLITGSSICPDAGCQTVESLTAVSPFYLNTLGFVFFQVVFWLLFFLKSGTDFYRYLMGLLLLSGLAFDTALLGYQLFAAHSLCSYCLLILFFVISLNILYGGRQTVAGFAVASAVILSFSVMVHFPAGAGSKGYSLKNAAYGLKSCASPTKEIYLIFSSDCPHCQKVIDALNNCNSCDLYLNPIGPIGTLNLDGLELNKGFSPAINRHILTVLGIDRIPVLVVKDEESYRFIRGENRILNFIRRACFTHDEVLYLDSSPQTVDKGITVLTEADEECSVEIDCEPKQDEKPFGISPSN